MKRFSLLLVLSGISSTVVASSEPEGATQVTPCQPRAYVRAPDLSPGSIIEGDVKVKLEGACDEVAAYEIRLRFSERGVVKTRRENASIPEHPESAGRKWGNSDIYDTHDHMWNGFQYSGSGGNQTAMEEYEKSLKDRSLWVVHEEERIGFEITHVLDTKSDEDALPGPVTINSFAILVPYTNFPPAFGGGKMMSGRRNVDVAYAEHIYQYFVDITFKNGTIMKIPAGYTSFNILGSKDLDFSPQTFNVTMTPRNTHSSSGRACEQEKTTSRDTFILEVTFPQGRHHYQGSEGNLTAVSHQFGPGLKEPLSLDASLKVHQKRVWAAKYAADNATADNLLGLGEHYTKQALPTPPGDHEAYPKGFGRGASFSNDSMIQAGSWFTSEEVSVSFVVAERSYPSFDMYYQSAVTDLQLRLHIQNVTLETADKIDNDDDDEWTPYAEKQMRLARDPSNYLQGTIPIFVHPKATADATHEPIHYLSPDARVPIFIDLSSRSELLHKTHEDRDPLAPIADPKYIVTEENVVKDRYYKLCSRPIYVGEMWHKKTMKDRERRERSSVPLLVQT